ncbi:MAG: response regulator [Proteobacteria bacterium]|nr:response regulator [Pseudomonadota bacterium]
MNPASRGGAAGRRAFGRVARPPNQHFCLSHTPPGGRIEVWAERSPGNRIKIQVKDSGIGIETAQRHRVFAPFERVENSYTVKQTGTGLGMPLTRRLAELNGGLCDFESSPGQGSTFWLLLPAAEYTAHPELAISPTAPVPTGSGEQLLLIGRGDADRPLLAKYLEHAGYRVTQADEPSEVLQQLRQTQYQLVLLGDEFTDLPNIELLRDIRTMPEGGALAIVLLSSRAFSFDVERYLRAGVDRCLSKPLELKEFVAAIQEVLASRRANVAQAAPSPRGKSTQAVTSNSAKTKNLLH